MLRWRASGRHTYSLQVPRALPDDRAIDHFSPRQARAEAERLRGDIARGKDPEAERHILRAATGMDLAKVGGRYWTRTSDPRRVKAMLYQLSQAPNPRT